MVSISAPKKFALDGEDDIKAHPLSPILTGHEAKPYYRSNIFTLFNNLKKESKLMNKLASFSQQQNLT